MSGIVLHVEDDPNDLLFVGMAFKKVAPQIRLIQVKDGQAAIDYLTGSASTTDPEQYPRPHLVLLDI